MTECSLQFENCQLLSEIRLEVLCLFSAVEKRLCKENLFLVRGWKRERERDIFQDTEMG